MRGINEQNAQEFINYNGPVPGQSLTNNPDQKYAWEQAPEFVNRRDAELFILEELTEKDKFIAITDMISEGMPLDIITRTYLMSGYSRGLWDVDLMMLLIEPTAFILMALAEKVGLEYELYAGEAEEDGEELPEEQEKYISKTVDIVKKRIEKVGNKPLETIKSTNKELVERIEAIPEETVQEVKGLLARPDTMEQPKSLLEAE